MSNHIINGIGHFDISGPDVAVLQSFYAGVFDWKIQPKGPGYAIAQTPDGAPNGSLVEAETPAFVIGIVVADLDRTIAETVRLGGSVAMPVVDNGWVKRAMLADPAGNHFTVIQV